MPSLGNLKIRANVVNRFLSNCRAQAAHRVCRRDFGDASDSSSGLSHRSKRNLPVSSKARKPKNLMRSVNNRVTWRKSPVLRFNHFAASWNKQSTRRALMGLTRRTYFWWNSNKNVEGHRLSCAGRGLEFPTAERKARSLVHRGDKPLVHN